MPDQNSVDLVAEGAAKSPAPELTDLWSRLLLSRLARRWISAASGCDSSLVVEAA